MYDIQTPGCKPDAAAKGAANWARGARRMSRLGKKGAANRSVFAIKRRQTGRLVETMRQILVTQSESQAMAEAANSGWKFADFSSFNLTQLPPNKKDQTRGENVSLRPLLPNVFPFDAKSCQSLPNLFLRGVRLSGSIYKIALWKKDFGEAYEPHFLILSKRFSCVMWHVFSWTKTTRRNLEGVWTFKDDNIHILFNVFASFRMDLAASLLTKGQCDAVSHQQRRVPSFTLHVEFDKSRSSVVYRNAPRYTSLSCGYTFPEINIDLLQSFLIAQNVVAHLHDWSWTKNWRLCDIRDTRNEAAIATLPYFAFYQSARTREDWETVIDKDCAPLSMWNLWQDFPEEVVVVRFMLLRERH